MITLYTTYLYARSFLERAFLDLGPFAHVTTEQMKSAFDDVENGIAPPFTYPYPPPVIQIYSNRVDDDFSIDYSWSCSGAYRAGPLCYQIDKGFSAEPMARLIQKRHGILCHICMNPTSHFAFSYEKWGFKTPLWIGKNSRGTEFPNICKECIKFAVLCRRHDAAEDSLFLKVVTKELRRSDSPLVKRLRNAPPLRFEPRKQCLEPSLHG